VRTPDLNQEKGTKRPAVLKSVNVRKVQTEHKKAGWAQQFMPKQVPLVLNAQAPVQLADGSLLVKYDKLVTYLVSWPGGGTQHRHVQKVEGPLPAALPDSRSTRVNVTPKMAEDMRALRKSNPRLWTTSKLAKEFKVPGVAVQQFASLAKIGLRNKIYSFFFSC